MGGGPLRASRYRQQCTLRTLRPDPTDCPPTMMGEGPQCCRKLEGNGCRGPPGRQAHRNPTADCYPWIYKIKSKIHPPCPPRIPSSLNAPALSGATYALYRSGPSSSSSLSLAQSARVSSQHPDDLPPPLLTRPRRDPPRPHAGLDREIGICRRAEH